LKLQGPRFFARAFLRAAGPMAAVTVRLVEGVGREVRLSADGRTDGRRDCVGGNQNTRCAGRLCHD